LQANLGEPIESVIERADKALYRAKRARRDRLEVDADPLLAPV
jgi:PleD family two-component response regulator